jgi:hypothetical protein
MNLAEFYGEICWNSNIDIETESFAYLVRK